MRFGSVYYVKNDGPVQSHHVIKIMKLYNFGLLKNCGRPTGPIQFGLVLVYILDANIFGTSGDINIYKCLCVTWTKKN